jgi:hypothetical protein
MIIIVTVVRLTGTGTGSRPGPVTTDRMKPSTGYLYLGYKLITRSKTPPLPGGGTEYDCGLAQLAVGPNRTRAGARARLPKDPKL